MTQHAYYYTVLLKFTSYVPLLITEKLQHNRFVSRFYQSVVKVKKVVLHSFHGNRKQHVPGSNKCSQGMSISTTFNQGAISAACYVLTDLFSDITGGRSS